MPWTEQASAHGRAAALRARRQRTLRAVKMANGPDRRDEQRPKPTDGRGPMNTSPAAWYPVDVHVPECAYVDVEPVALHAGVNYAATLGARDRHPFGLLLAQFDRATDSAAAKARDKNPFWPKGYVRDEARMRQEAVAIGSVVVKDALRVELREAARELAKLKARERELREFLSRGGR